MTTATNLNALESQIRAVLDEHSLLKHPFYQEWTTGTLPVERLQEYARQYFHFEAAFPRFLSAIHARTESAPIRQIILDNLWDEEHGERNHRQLWLDFGAALGLSEEEIVTSTPRPETSALVEHYYSAARTAPVAEAMATMFAYEGQVPAIAWQKIKGLSENYGFTPDQFEFFSTHLVADIAHSGSEMEAIFQSTEDEDAVVAATASACEKLWSFLDGCYAEPLAGR